MINGKTHLNGCQFTSFHRYRLFFCETFVGFGGKMLSVQTMIEICRFFGPSVTFTATLVIVKLSLQIHRCFGLVNNQLGVIKYSQTFLLCKEKTVKIWILLTHMYWTGNNWDIIYIHTYWEGDSSYKRNNLTLLWQIETKETTLIIGHLKLLL